MTYRIEDIQGIGPVHAVRLALGCSVTGRQKVAEITGLNEGQILKWANMADLMRISGIGPQYAELLEAAGVDTIKELRTRQAANLAATMAVVNQSNNLSGATPMENTVQEWIDGASNMVPLISH